MPPLAWVAECARGSGESGPDLTALAYQIPTGVPTRFAAGTTLSFKVPQLQQFPVSESWVYKLHLLGRTSKSVTATSSGTEYTFTLAAADSANLQPGTYRWSIRATKALESYHLGSGTLEILQEAAVSDNTDARSWAEKMLAAVESLLYGNGTIADVESYQIHGRQLVKMSRAELMTWRNKLRMEMLQERNGGRLPPIEIGFRRA